MQIKRTKSLSFIVSAIIVIGTLIVAAAVFALPASAETEDYYTYTISNGEATITNVSISISGNVTIPSSFGEYPVTAIGNDALNCSSITSITIPDSVTSIGDQAFYKCTNLKTVTLGSGSKLESIGGSAFSECSNLESIFIPASASSIGSNAFYKCSNLKTVTFGSGCKLTSIENNSFEWCTSLESMIIPDGVTTINQSAFYGCRNLKSITIPASVTFCDSTAFSGCDKLEDVYISDFKAWCNIDFNGTQSNPLYYADNLHINGALIEDVVIPDGITEISYMALSCASFKSVTIPSSVTTICDQAFEGCTNLETVIFEDNSKLDSIGWGGFRNCPKLKSINLGDLDKLTSIDIGVFYGCSALESIVIPDGVTVIEGGLFSGCTSLKNVTLPEGIMGIGNQAFLNCSSLEDLIIPDSVALIGSEAFKGCTSLIKTDNGVQYADDWAVGCDTSLTSLPIRKDTRGIANAAFYNCLELTNVIFANDGKLLYIGENVFRSCTSLASITIPEGVKDIGSGAFYMCSGLKSIIIPAGVSSLGESVFLNCNADLVIKCHESSAAHTYASDNSIAFELIHFFGDDGVCYVCNYKDDTDTETESETDTDINTESQTETDIESETDATTETVHDTETEAQSQSESEPSSESQSETQETADTSGSDSIESTASGSSNDQDNGGNITASNGCGSCLGGGAFALITTLILCGIGIARKKKD